MNHSFIYQNFQKSSSAEPHNTAGSCAEASAAQETSRSTFKYSEKCREGAAIDVRAERFEQIMAAEPHNTAGSCGEASVAQEPQGMPERDRR